MGKRVALPLAPRSRGHRNGAAEKDFKFTRTKGRSGEARSAYRGKRVALPRLRPFH